MPVPWLVCLVALMPRAACASDLLLCRPDGSEDWPSVQRRLFRVLDGAAAMSALSAELERANAAAQESPPEEGLSGDCAPGRISLRGLLLLATPSVGLKQAGALLAPAWRLLGQLGWPALLRTGWPVFRLLRLLQRHCKGDAASVDGCEDGDEAFVLLLKRQVQRRQLLPGESLLASSARYLAQRGGWCPLSAAAAFLALAWLRYPVYDSETEDLLRLAEPLVSPLDLERLLATPHPLLDMVADVAGSYQAFLIDSGALYQDLRPKSTLAGAVDYTRHMMSNTVVDGVCPLAAARTPLGRCNPFAPLGLRLAPWRQQGVVWEDTLATWAEAEGPPVALFRIAGGSLAMMLPPRGPMRSEEASGCLSATFLTLMTYAPLPAVDLLIRLGPGPPSEPRGAPIFAACAREGSAEVPLPRLCGLTCLEAGDFGHGEAPPTPVPASKANASGLDAEEPVLCYLFRLLAAFEEMLRYGPEDVPLPIDRFDTMRTWRLPPPPPEAEVEEFHARCAAMMSHAAE